MGQYDLKILYLEGQQNCMIGSKVITILPPFFKKKSSTSNVCMWCVYQEALDLNFALRIQILFCVSVSEEKVLSEPKTKLVPFRKVFLGSNFRYARPK